MSHRLPPSSGRQFITNSIGAVRRVQRVCLYGGLYCSRENMSKTVRRFVPGTWSRRTFFHVFLICSLPFFFFRFPRSFVLPLNANPPSSRALNTRCHLRAPSINQHAHPNTTFSRPSFPSQSLARASMNVIPSFL